MNKKLYRSISSRMICGVCGGIGEYFNIDPNVVRIGFVILGCGGVGIITYIVAAIILPEK
ncbi:PspC domain-containing protein [Ruminococcus sp. Marseille-P6503]|uniref:PspC domain-containing protein n=1 Tax=Ruminococcus sp. Marseille-P6503 TaxID=2364796 RepID=UPI000F528555|nr:PspC domain-containing protein [Ruminococcus sp. Marseille-P6503]